MLVLVDCFLSCYCLAGTVVWFSVCHGDDGLLSVGGAAADQKSSKNGRWPGEIIILGLGLKYYNRDKVFVYFFFLTLVNFWRDKQQKNKKRPRTVSRPIKDCRHNNYSANALSVGFADC